MEPTVLLTLVLFNVASAVICGRIARRKGLSVSAFVLLGLFLSWVGILFAAIARSRRVVPAAATQDDVELADAKRRILEGV